VLQFYRAVAEAYGRIGVAAKVSIVVGTVLVGTGLAVAIVVLLPADHFRDPGVRAAGALARSHPVLRALGLVVKNLLGAVILPMGILMALPLVPGPGLVFILVGLSLLDFPGKRRLERRLLAVPSVRRFLNEVRHRFGREPLVFDGEGPS
jgi:hypothetical protein